MSVNELKKIVNYISEYTFGVKFDKNGNYNEFKYNRNYKRGIYTRDDIRKEMVEIFGQFSRTESKDLYNMSFYPVGVDFEEERTAWVTQQVHMDLSYMTVFG